MPDTRPQKRKVQALVFVGDAMEEADRSSLRDRRRIGVARRAGVRRFRKATIPRPNSAFREIARLTRGAYCRFDISAAHELAELLRAVAAYAAGGMKALADLKARNSGGAVKLLAQLR